MLVINLNTFVEQYLCKYYELWYSWGSNFPKDHVVWKSKHLVNLLLKKDLWIKLKKKTQSTYLFKQPASTLFVGISNIATVHLNTNITGIFIWKLDILIASFGIEVNIVLKCNNRNKLSTSMQTISLNVEELFKPMNAWYGFTEFMQ